jgi:hypothetical protein
LTDDIPVFIVVGFFVVVVVVVVLREGLPVLSRLASNSWAQATLASAS